MSEWLAGAKVTMLSASVVGGALSMGFIQMPIKKRIFAIGAGAAMSYYIGSPVALWVGLDPEPTGFLIGLFGVSICHLIFESLKKSDLSIKFEDIANLFRKG